MTPIANFKRLSRRSRATSGVSLLEVLFAIGILTVGLLGVAAVIPLGGRKVAEAGKADRMAACGRAILNDAKVRGVLDPLRWRYRDGSHVVITDSNQNHYLCHWTYVIDPMFIAYNPGDTKATNFPYGTDPTDMKRVTLQSLASPYILSFAEAEQLCVWRDDLLFPVPDEPEDRPRALVLADTGSKIESIRWPVRTSDNVSGSPTALKLQNEGRFSWILTVTPEGRLTTISGNKCVAVDEKLTWQVSVVVFFNRDLTSIADLSAERTIADVQFLGGGFGGGDVEIASKSTEELKENDWLMVPFVPSSTTPKRFAWYRVVAADEWAPNTSSRYVTLSGADWAFGYNPTNPGAIWLPEAIGVFSATIPSETRD